MPRSRISRTFASAFAVWLAICLAEPVQLHTCAMHSGLAVEQGTAWGAHDHSSTAGSLAANTGADHSEHDQSSDGESRQCSCIGDCNAGRSPVGIAPAGFSLVTAAITEASTTGFAYASPPLLAPAFLLPFSNGPPAGSSRA